MCTLIFSESGGSIRIGFAIPSSKIKATIEDLLKGGVNRNYWLGIRAADMTGIMHRVHGLASNEGAVVTSVEPGSPAAKAGIKFEDIILAINDQTVAGALDARKILGNTDLRVGDKLKLTISRKGKQIEVEVTLAPLPTTTRQQG
jgi:serine protease Do/serine protease DegQ